MSKKKVIMVDGKPHRMRRGKLVEIPAWWLGKVTSRQTINARPSKLTHKMRRLCRRPPPTGMYRRDNKDEV